MSPLGIWAVGVLVASNWAGDERDRAVRDNETESIPTWEFNPDRVIEVDPALWVRGIAVTPDGKRAYIRATMPTVNLWVLAVSGWPEILGLTLIALCLLRIRRVLRGPGIRIEEECAGCGYLLRGLTSARCPECGLPLTDANRRRERTRRALVVFWLTMIGCVNAAYWPAVDRLPRDLSIGGWMSSRSTAAYDLWRWWRAKEFVDRYDDPDWDSAGHGDIRFLDPRDRICEIDLPTGRILRWIRDEPGMLCHGTVALSPDGASLFLALVHVEQIDAAGGRTIREFRYSGLGLVNSIALTPDGRRLYGVGWRSSRFCAAECVCWDVQNSVETAAVPWPFSLPLRRAYDNDHPAFRPSLTLGRLDFFCGNGCGLIRDFATKRWLCRFATPGGHSGIAIDRQHLFAFRHGTIFVYDLKRLLADAPAGSWEP